MSLNDPNVARVRGKIIDHIEVIRNAVKIYWDQDEPTNYGTLAIWDNARCDYETRYVTVFGDNVLAALEGAKFYDYYVQAAPPRTYAEGTGLYTAQGKDYHFAQLIVVDTSLGQALFITHVEWPSGRLMAPMNVSSCFCS